MNNRTSGFYTSTISPQKKVFLDVAEPSSSIFYPLLTWRDVLKTKSETFAPGICDTVTRFLIFVNVVFWSLQLLSQQWNRVTRVGRRTKGIYSAYMRMNYTVGLSKLEQIKSDGRLVSCIHELKGQVAIFCVQGNIKFITNFLYWKFKNWNQLN